MALDQPLNAGKYKGTNVKVEVFILAEGWKEDRKFVILRRFLWLVCSALRGQDGIPSLGYMRSMCHTT